MDQSAPSRVPAVSLRAAAFGSQPPASRPGGRSPAITVGLLVMPLAIAVALFIDRNSEGADLVLRPSFAAADQSGGAPRFAGLVP